MQGRVVLGARVEDACQGPSDYATALDTFANEPYAITYRPETNRAYVLLKQGASVQDTLCGAFSAHVLLHMLDAVQGKPSLPALQLLPQTEPGTRTGIVSNALTALQHVDDPHSVLLNVTAAKGYKLYQEFVHQASDLGWNLGNTMLNPKEPRLIPSQLA